MTEARWLDGYSGQTTDELLALAGEYRVDSVVVAFEAGLQAKALRLGRVALSEPESFVLAVEALEREVNSGGYLNFLGRCPEDACIVVRALRQMGAATAADLREEALHAIGIQEPLTAAAVCEAASAVDPDDAVGATLDELDSRYDEAVGDLAPVVFEFLARSRQEVRLPWRRARRTAVHARGSTQRPRNSTVPVARSRIRNRNG